MIQNKVRSVPSFSILLLDAYRAAIPFWRPQANRIRQLFRKKVISQQPKDTLDPIKFYLYALLESFSAFQQSGEGIHLQNAIQYSQIALSQRSSEISHRITLLIPLAALFTEVYYQSFDLASLKKAIEYSPEAMDLTPAGNLDRAGRLNNLSIRLSTRYGKEGKLEDLSQAIEYSQSACKCLSSPPSNRLSACQDAVNLLTSYQRWFEAREMVDHGLEILPFLI